MLPLCYHTIPNPADPPRTASVPNVEILKSYVVVGLGGHVLRLSLKQQVSGPDRATDRVVGMCSPI